MPGKIIAMYIYPQAGALGLEKSNIELVAGAGIVGDRYYKRDGTFSKGEKLLAKQEITFIEAEQVDFFNTENDCKLAYSQLRRNIITQGVQLKDLVGAEFHFGGQRFKGVELCEPCAYLAKTVESKLLPAMVGKCGLRAQILNHGELIVGSEINFA